MGRVLIAILIIVAVIVCCHCIYNIGAVYVQETGVQETGNPRSVDALSVTDSQCDIDTWVSGWGWPGLEKEVECVAYVVGSGETLWQIAKKYYPDLHTGRVVWFIRHINNRQGADGPILQPGDVIIIPDPMRYGIGRK